MIRSLHPDGGGPAEGIRRITQHLIRLDVSTTVVSLDNPDSLFLENQPFNVIALGPVFSGYGFRLGLIKLLSQLASEHDVVIIHGLWQYHAIASWFALRHLSKPYYVYPHGMLDPWFKKRYPLKHLKKCLYWLLADYYVLRDANAVLFTTSRESELARHSFFPYKAHEAVVGYGTSAPPANIESQLSIFFQHYPSLINKRILLFLGRIHPKKGIDLLIQAFADSAQVDNSLHLVIAGPDQVGLKTSLEKLSLSLGISKCITWTGMLTDELKWGAYRAAELFCLPSHQENFGIAVAEALACSTPVMISSSVNISSDVLAAKAGLVHLPTCSSTSEALRSWLLIDDHIKSSMSSNAYQLFISRYDYASQAASLLKVLTKTARYHSTVSALADSPPFS